MKTVLITDSENLLRIAHESIARGFNRLPSDALLDNLDPNGTHVISFWMPHDHIAGKQVEPHWRTIILCKVKGTAEPSEVMIDMSQENLDSLHKEEVVGSKTGK